MSDYLRRLVPDSNRLEVAFASHNHNHAGKLLEAMYAEVSGFVGAFLDRDDQPTWARRAAEYLKHEFFDDTPGRIKLFSDMEPALAVGDGGTYINCRHALNMWVKGGRKGPMPFGLFQDYGSCVDACKAEGCDTLLGWRAAQPSFREVFLHPAAWYDYANRGYCSDGWTGSGSATQARRNGLAFRIKYDLAGNSVDFTDDDKNEQIVARTWCRTGIPDWLLNHTRANHAFEDGAITAFNTGVPELLKVFKAGGFVHCGGTRTSGGSRPFTPGRVGPHMQTGHGGDDSDNFRKFCQDVIGVPAKPNDFPVAMGQTWGPGWSGECADRYWPFGTDASGKVWTMADVKTGLSAGTIDDAFTFDLQTRWGWGWKPEGAWVCWASWLLQDIEYAWLPMVRGFPGTPSPEPVSQHPQIVSRVRVDQVGQVPAVRGGVALTLDGKLYEWIYTPNGDSTYSLIPKPSM